MWTLIDIIVGLGVGWCLGVMVGIHWVERRHGRP